MPFYSGTANSYADLRGALFAACVANGWAQADGETITKSSAVVRAVISTSSTDALGAGLVFQGATGLSGSNLVNPSRVRPRFGSPHRTVNTETWPMIYSIHIFTDPDEVFLVAQFNVDTFYWAAFGVSSVPNLAGTGLWLSAVSRTGTGPNTGAGGILITQTGGGGQQALVAGYSSGAAFWNTDPAATASYGNDTVHTRLETDGWAGSVGTTVVRAGNVCAIHAVAPLMARQPNQWNGETVLLPIQVYESRAESKCSLVVDVRNARYVRIDNHEPGDLITLGDDRWRVYPFYRRDLIARNGGNAVNHTGTFGWAIRYDGP